MPIEVPFFDRSQSFDLPDVEDANIATLSIRPAKVGDVHGMSTLINSYAAENVMLARGPQYLFQHLQDYMVATAKAKGGDKDCIVACGALNILWSDLAEIRSIAVHRACQHYGLGQRLVKALIDRCRTLEIPRVFVFTLADRFFARCGFLEFSRDELPPVVWAECSKCPKFYRCDEISMMHVLEETS
ncbi:MAG: N-acetyltransferase [Desulfovibrio sp.]|nr:N-acetyltransferase [Desulfovibrio sp.]